MGHVAVGSGADSLVAELSSRAGREDPYPVYAALRERAPVARSADGSLLLTRYDDCSAALRDAAVGHRDTGHVDRLGAVDEWQQHLSLWQLQTSMLALDPPEHTRLRRLVSGAFGPRRVAGLRGVIESVTARLLDELPDHPDFITGFGFPLPIAVIGELLGVPAVDQPAFQHLARDWVQVLDVTTPRVLARADAAATEIRSYLSGLAAERRAAPRADLLSALVSGAGGERLTDDEVLTMAALLFAAGFETATHLLGNGLVTLLAHPAAAAQLRQARVPLDAAIDELLRYDCPVQIARRVVLRETTVGGLQVGDGERIIACIGAANRDPARFPAPDVLDLERRDGSPMSFGAGIHHCLGAALARLEAELAFPALLRRFPRLSVAGPLHHKMSVTVRGYSKIPVSVS